MGNHLAAMAPSQILSVESYLSDASSFTFDKSLGSTRFMKVARAKFQEGFIVVKVFVIPDQSINLESYKSEVEAIKGKLKPASNCVPFQQTIITDRAALLVRQYAKHNLYDRISTRPFYNNIEKRWIAFQLLCALNQIAKLNIFHGDIKSENILVTSWNWLLLTDFASFKPLYLPNDNPADFNYYFDTSRRRTCYIAPERFTDQWSNLTTKHHSSDQNHSALHAMDIFSAGCVIAELFTEGSGPFNLSQLLAYREEKFNPDACISKIEDPDIQGLVKHMIQRDPIDRGTAEWYLTQWKGSAFPNHFYTFLKYYLGKFSEPPLMSSDHMVIVLHKDMPKIASNLVNSEAGADSLVLIASLLLSCIRKLIYVNCKLKALQLIVEFSKHLGSEIILERFVPYLIYFIKDSVSRVKAHAIKALATCLTYVKEVPRGESNIFSEYILPEIESCVKDNSVPVRQAFAENIAIFAEVALRFLDGSQFNNGTSSISTFGGEQVSYDVLLQPLIDTLENKVQTLMSDSDANVRQSLLEFSVGRLCGFFGKQKANDVLLTHMITFLNDKQDWQLRALFFTSLVRIAAYIGWQSSHILKTLLQQGLSDNQEFVVSHALTALSCLVELGLLQKQFVCELMRESISFLVHPCQWIRLKTVAFLCACGRVLDPIDVHCYLLPALKPFLQYQILQVDKERILLNALRPYVKYKIYDLVLNASDRNLVFEALKKRQEERNAVNSEKYDENLEVSSVVSRSSGTLKKLFLKDMSTNDEEMLLQFEQFISRRNHSIGPGSSTSFDWQNEDISDEGVILISAMGGALTKRHAELVSDSLSGGKVVTKKPPNRRKLNSQSQDMNEDWRAMFGADGSKAHSATTSTVSKKTNPNMSITMSQLENSSKSPVHQKTEKQGPIQYKSSACKLELKELVHHRRELYKIDLNQRDLEEQADNYSSIAVTNWKPRGHLVAHMREHRGPIYRIAVSPQNYHFVTVSADRSARLWEGIRLEGKAVVNRSIAAYSSFSSAVKCVTFCDDESFVCASDNGSIDVLSVELMSPKSKAEKPESLPTPATPVLYSHSIDTSTHGKITDLKSVVNSQVVAFSTSHGSITALDLRSGKAAWVLVHNLAHGLPTSFCLDPRQHWLCVGTVRGVHVCWDLRFQLPITNFNHPSFASVRRVTTHPSISSCIMSVATGNNEISIWDIETGTRQMALWASTAPPLSLSQKSVDSVNGLCSTVTPHGIRMFTGGTDSRLRMWDLNEAENSKIICGPDVSSSRSQYTASYQTRLVDGTHVIQEQLLKTKVEGSDDTGPSPVSSLSQESNENLAAAAAASNQKSRLFEHAVPLHHHDVITDVALFHVNQTFLVSTARDGIVKIWK